MKKHKQKTDIKDLTDFDRTSTFLKLFYTWGVKKLHSVYLKIYIFV